MRNPLVMGKKGARVRETRCVQIAGRNGLLRCGRIASFLCLLLHFTGFYCYEDCNYSHEHPSLLLCRGSLLTPLPVCAWGDVAAVHAISARLSLQKHHKENLLNCSESITFLGKCACSPRTLKIMVWGCWSRWCVADLCLTCSTRNSFNDLSNACRVSRSCNEENFPVFSLYLGCFTHN